MSSRLILLETSTALCSTALAEDGKVVCTRRSDEPRSHASVTAPFVKEMLDECGWTVSGCDAVCVSKGPGSYTGLRVGVSTAKGLCFGADRPLIAVDTLEVLASQAIGAGCMPEGCAGILPMVDARRMEAYAAVFSPEGLRLSEIAPVILEEGSFGELFAKGPVVVIGDAAGKFAALRCPDGQGTKLAAGEPVTPGLIGGHRYVQCCPEASAMLVPAMRRYAKKEFEDVAYFEPLYIKEFTATVSRKKLF